MQTKEENQLLTQTDRGTPMGELYRRFWLPALLSEELPGADCVPVRFRLLGEDLLAFRDSNGRPGIIDQYCPHRGAPLFFGRNEEAGLRCVYHGWKFDVDGNCVDLPNAPEGDTFRHKVKVLSYPTFEAGRMLWVYMGPRELQPPRPGFEWLENPDSHIFVTKYFLDCNYLQTLENEWSESHAAFLHSSARNGPINRRRPIGAVQELFETDYGAVTGLRRDDGTYSLGGHWMIPFGSSAGAVSAPGTNPVNIKLPVDDTHTVFFRIKWSMQPLKPEIVQGYLHDNHEFPTQMPGTYRTVANKSNDYLIDRVKQRHFNYTGMDPYPVQDFAVAEDQRGSIADRTKETLVSTDRYIIYARNRLMRMARALQQGVEPQEPWRPQAYRGIANFKRITGEEPEYRRVWSKPRLAPSLLATS